MYEDLIKSLRICEGACNKECVLYNSVQVDGDTCQNRLCAMAADAIEKLSKCLGESIPKSDAEIIIEELSKPRWIPVTEQLPNPYDIVLGYDGCEIGFASWQQRGKYWLGGEVFDDTNPEITHWTPLPEPPEEETE